MCESVCMVCECGVFVNVFLCICGSCRPLAFACTVPGSGSVCRCVYVCACVPLCFVLVRVPVYVRVRCVYLHAWTCVVSAACLFCARCCCSFRGFLVVCGCRVGKKVSSHAGVPWRPQGGAQTQASTCEGSAPPLALAQRCRIPPVTCRSRSRAER